MGFLSLLVDGIVMGCESDLDATLTMMLFQGLFGKPGFLHNSSVETEKNHYWGSHCTAPSRMNGVNMPAEHYELTNHHGSNKGTVPRVFFKEGQEATLARYLSWPPEPISEPTITSRASRSSEASSQKPQLLLYSGQIISGYTPNPPAGGCRLNFEMTINELDRVTDLIGNHMVMFYGNHVKQIKQFCQLYDIEVVV